MITKIYHKKNELSEIEFYEDKECTQSFDFQGKKNLYLELNQDMTPLVSLCDNNIYIDTNYYVPYCPHLYTLTKFRNIITLDDITPNLSKYIAEDNAVLFLSEEDKEKYPSLYDNNICCFSIKELETWELKFLNDKGEMEIPKKATIFISHGTETKLKEAIELAKSLKKQYGIEEVNLFVLHCFVNLKPCYLPQISYVNGVLTYHFFEVLTHTKQEQILAWAENVIELQGNYYFGYINTITTTNSTKIACMPKDSYYENRPQLKNKLNILDCYDIFNDYLQSKNE
jgi:hypothetical protein